jgi:hypothetical protein
VFTLSVALPCLVLCLCCSTLGLTSLAQASTGWPQMRTPSWVASREMQGWIEGPGSRTGAVLSVFFCLGELVLTTGLA